MHKRFFLLCSLLLVACAPRPNPNASVRLDDLVQNPLYAEAYYETLLDRMVELDIQHDPVLKDGSMKAYVDKVRRDALEKAKDATAKQHEGYQGPFVMAKEDVGGEALYLANTLYLGPTFQTNPGPALHIFLSKGVDPRDVKKFPDEGSMDLGRLESAFGAQQYKVPEVENPVLYRTVVLYDVKLGRIYSFAQLAK